MSFLTDDEVQAIQTLPRETPYLIRDVSMGYFSIARYYGAANYNGQRYTYYDETDELIRDDVLAFVLKLRKKKRQPRKET